MFRELRKPLLFVLFRSMRLTAPPDLFPPVGGSGREPHRLFLHLSQALI
jgi:hypothetical protein